MLKTDLVKQVAKTTGLSSERAHEVVNAIFDEITLSLSANREVRLMGFGSFQVKLRQERLGRDPKTQQSLLIPEHNAVHFRPAKALKHME